MYSSILPQSTVFAYLIHLSANGQYIHTKHALMRQGKRQLTDEQLTDIMSNPTRLIRTDDASSNLNGLPSYKIEGGADKHRVAIQFIDLDDNGELSDDTYVNIITVMNK